MYMNNEKYIQQSGQYCPNEECQAPVRASGLDPVCPTLAIRECWCEECGLEWTENYVLSGYDLNDE